MNPLHLKFINSKPILHLIDHATRYSAAVVLRSKEKDEVISKIFQIWISYFGSPTQILSDNGGEFNNNDFRIMEKNLTQRSTAQMLKAHDPMGSTKDTILFLAE